jgi:uncharacterized membrane protein YgaE (UPF0421/DUF939 family)
MAAPDDHHEHLTAGSSGTSGCTRGTSRLAPPLKWLGAPVLQAAKTAVAAGLSWFIAADIIGNNLPVFAPLATILTVQVTVWDSVSRGVQRVLGVIVGVLVAFGFARLVGTHVWTVVLVVFFSWLAGQVLRLGTQGAVQVPVTALLVLVLGTTTNEYALDRVVDTFLGAGIGVAVSLVALPRTHLAEAQAEVRHLATDLATLLREMAAALVRPDEGSSGRLGRARQMGDEAGRTAAIVQSSAAATRWNPSGYRDRPAAQKLDAALKTLRVVERATGGIARALADAPAGLWLPPGTASALCELVDGVADELEAWASRVTSGAEDGGDPGRSDVAARYHDVVVAARSRNIKPETAAIVDAIAIDANRISAELEAEPEPASTRDRLNWRSLLNP